MATFQYQAVTPAGRLMKGAVEAGSQPEAAQMLEQMQLTVNALAKAEPESSATSVGRNEFLLFNQQLASITKAGIPLDRGLRELANDVGSRSMRKLILQVADDLSAGVSIEDAVERRKKHFPALYGRILKAGVETGRLSEMLTSLNRHLEVGVRTKRIILEALCYPVVVLALAAVIITGLFVMVIPAFGEILADMSDGQGRLPWLTQTILKMADNVVPFWIGVFILIALALAVYAILSASPGGRRIKEPILLGVPIMGRLYRSGILARIAEAMALLIGAGCEMGQCLRLSAGASGSEKMKFECDLLASEIEQGLPIMEAGHACQMIPRLFLYSVQLGSQRNELQDNLLSLGQMYGYQTRCLQSNLQALLLPSLIIILGLFVATTVLAMFLPMVSIISALM